MPVLVPKPAEPYAVRKSPAAPPKANGVAPSNWSGAAIPLRLTPPRAASASADPAVKLFPLLLLFSWSLGLLQAEEKKEGQPALQALIAKTPEEKAKAKALSASYPLQICFVSNDKLEDPIDTLYGDRLLRFCCKGCVRSFNKNPSKFLPKLDALKKSAS